MRGLSLSRFRYDIEQAVAHASKGRPLSWAVLFVYRALHALLCVGIFYLLCVHSLGLLRREASLLVTLFYLILIFLESVYSATDIGSERMSELMISQATAIFIAYTGMFVIFNVIRYLDANFFTWLASFALSLVFTVMWTLLGNTLYFLLFPPLKTIIVQGSNNRLDVFQKLRAYPKKLQIVERVEVASLGNDFSSLKNYHAVLLNELNPTQRSDLLKYCVGNGIKVFIRPKISDLLLDSSKRTGILNLPLISIRHNDPDYGYLLIKRLLDILLSLLALILLSPVLLLFALLIKLHDGGPAIYRQTRLTKGGKTFSIWKFRSMVMDAEKDGVARLSTENDDRITPIGKIIRRYRIDELPQLVNILLGHMSIVGPRPERPEIAEDYMKDFPEFKLRLLAKAGLTGYAQVYGKYNAVPYDKVQMDLIYIATQSFFTDLKLIFATIRALLSKDSTEGIMEGQTTAALDAEPDKEKS